jgi:Uma2 family endonuclease
MIVARIPLEVGPDDNGMLMIPQEFDAIEDWEEGYRYELIHGVFIVNPPPSIGERNPNDELGYWLRSYRDTHLQGSALDDTAPEQIIRTRTGRRVVDRAVWVGLGRTPDYDHEPPAIAIEFVGPRSRDRQRDYLDKRQEYAEAGVREYWIIDRFRRTMTVFHGMSEEQVFGEGQTYSTDLLPGFELPLSRLLAIADRCS